MKKYKFLLRFSTGSIKLLVAGFLMYLIFFLVNSVSPFLTRYLIDNAFNSDNADKLLNFIVLSLIVLITLCVSGILSNYWIARTMNRINNRMKSAMIKKLQGYDEAFFRNNKSGDINFRVLNDVDSVVGFYGITFITIPIDVIVLLVLGSVLVKWSLLLSVIVYGLLLFQLLVVTKIRTRVLKYYKRQKESYQDLSGFVIEFFRNLNLLKGINMQKKMTQHADLKLDHLEKLNVRTSVVSNLMSSTSILINNAWVFLILWVGGQAVIEGTMTVGTLMAFLMITGMLYPRIDSMVTNYIKLQDIAISLGRVLEYYNYDTRDSGHRRHLPLIMGEGEVIVHNLSYSYADELTLSQLNFHIQPKAVTVIAGRNGSGKTTLCKLLAGFFDPGSGSIQIDGQDLSEVQVEDIRSHIMYQPQDQFLMSGTILDNIVCGDESYDLDEINQAIHKARVAEFIQTLPDGLNTYIGEISSSVSGGQAQRIALARLFYRRPKIIILDEPTSFIDVAGKTLFNELVTDLKEYSTIVIVSHDLGIIGHADHIINLDEIKMEEIS
ncbi:ABC transporter ATP-binding protein [Paenibacillus sp. S150]|uniref:ABC transporter ATP-binding protein n=1 Tax=Paenibacillus sp. S150 TaxID=2749826 RepID=UPI001C578C68|nr:ABC transporter ATP-binding protein [Paenibacillus sp. S150]MBW4081527.1 ABC transporter ATP-binding protein [Paenibacillus sp. S150]